MSGLLQQAADALQGLPPELVVLIISALPVFEIRGGVLVGQLLFHLPTGHVLLWGFLGNILSVTPVLLLLQPLSRWLYSNRFAGRLLHWLFSRAQRKADQINRWGPLGLMLFTAIPLPASGAWTAAFASILLGIRRRRAIASIYAGIAIAGVAVSLLTHGASAGARGILGP